MMTRSMRPKGMISISLGESWGSCRSLFPLGLILEPERQDDIINSYIRSYEQCGFLGDAALNRRVMIGRHEAVTIADAYFKGFRGFDAEKAFSGMKKNATEVTMIPWRNGPVTEPGQCLFCKRIFPCIASGSSRMGPAGSQF